MEDWMLISGFVGLLGLVGLGGLRLTPGKRAKTTALATGDVTALALTIAASPEAGQATKWDQSIGELWQAYEREAALNLIVEAARRSDAMIVQYWIDKALQVEPELAAHIFTIDFLAEHYRPDVAKKCGKRCGCG